MLLPCNLHEEDMSAAATVCHVFVHENLSIITFFNT